MKIFVKNIPNIRKDTNKKLRKQGNWLQICRKTVSKGTYGSHALTLSLCLSLPLPVLILSFLFSPSFLYVLFLLLGESQTVNWETHDPGGSCEAVRKMLRRNQKGRTNVTLMTSWSTLSNPFNTPEKTLT